MQRALALLVIPLVLWLCAGSAAAKPKVAVLGLEVTGTIDQQSTGVAHDVTEGLRQKARSGGGNPYQLASSSDRELIDEKVLKNCDSEGPLCMSDIGRDIGADVLIYGKLEKTGDGYRAKLHVLDVRKKSHQKEMTIAVPSGTNSDGVRTIAKKAYTDLVGGGGPPTGTVVITANVDSGTVFVDDEQSVPVEGGKASVTLPEGRYRIAVESPGKRRKEKTVTIASGEQVSETYELGALGGGGKSNVWKPIFGVSLAVTVVLGGVSLYSFISWKGKVDNIDAMYTAASGKTGPVSDADCSGGGISANVMDDNGTLGDVCSRRQLNIITGIAAAGMGVVTLGAAYMAFRNSGGKSETAGLGARRKRGTEVVVTPLVTPDSGGAILWMRW
ncbi:MAG: hypothetical protein JNL83_18940 [Myxococcales bacterium]|nr:hypothetical protein [Myxococcales bacterium]